MANAQNYRFKCRNTKCQYETLRRYNIEEFDKLQYGSTGGIGCFQCGYPRMAVIKSNRFVQDGFKPGFQRNIRKHCETYGQYKAHLKKMGLLEIGYEDLEENEDGHTQYWTEDILKKVYDHGFKISGNEVAALKNGDL